MGNFTEKVKEVIIRHWNPDDETLYKDAPWSVASNIENANGKRLEDTIGKINGLSNSLYTAADGYAFDAKGAQRIVQEILGNCVISYDETSGVYYIQNGADETTKKPLGTQIIDHGGIESVFIKSIQLAGLTDAPASQTICVYNSDVIIDTTQFSKMKINSITCTTGTNNINYILFKIKDGNSAAEIVRVTNTSDSYNNTEISTKEYDITNFDNITFEMGFNVDVTGKNIAFTATINGITLYN